MKQNKRVNSTRVPVYRDAGFELFDAETTAGAFRKEAENERVPEWYIYSRYRNPTVIAAEDEIMKLEKSNWALLTQSGMSAVDCALSAFQRGGEVKPWLFFSEIYGGTISFTENILKKRRGLDIRYFSPSAGKYDMKEFEKLLKEVKPELVYIEAISNPMLIVTDANAVIGLSKKYGAKVIVDNTFATPALWRPLSSGADIVLHSVTKYFSGHGNITGGVLCGNDESLMKEALEYRKFTGHMMSPDDAYRLTTQLQTFELRFAQQCINATSIATLLTDNELIEKIWYPGLSNHPTYEEAAKLFNNKAFGGMVTFDFAGKTPEIKRGRRDTFIKNVSDHIKLVPTLGDPHSILMPVESVWGAKYPEPGMIRLSAGFEPTEVIIDVISRGLMNI